MLLTSRARPSRLPRTVQALEAAIQTEPRRLDLRIRLAALQAKEGRRFLAIEQLEAARALGRNDAVTAGQLADLYRSVGEVDDAAEVLAPHARSETAATDIRIAYANSSLARGAFAEAAEALQPLARNWTGLDGATQETVLRHLILAGRWEEAEPLIARAPSGAEALSLRGLFQVLTRKGKQAVVSLQQAVKRSPTDAWNRYLLGRAFLAVGEPRRALDAFEAAAQLPGAPPEAALQAATLHVHEARLADAEYLLRAVENKAQETSSFWKVRRLLAEKRGNSVEERLALGEALYYAGDPWAAETIWRVAWEQFRGREPQARDLLASLVRSGEARYASRTALQYAEIGVSWFPKSLLFQRRRTELLVSLNRLPEAQASLRGIWAVAAPDDAADLWDLQARVALERGEGAALKDAAERSASAAPGDGSAFLLLAEWEQQQGASASNRERAVRLCQEALRRNPKDVNACLKLGTLLTQGKDYSGAVPMLHRALDLAPRAGDGLPHVHLAQIYRRWNRIPEAEFHERRYQKLRALKDAWTTLLPVMSSTVPGVADCLRWGDTSLQRNDSLLGLFAFARAAKLDPKNPAAWRGLAAAERRLGRFDEAVDAIRRAVLLDRQARS